MKALKDTATIEGGNHEAFLKEFMPHIDALYNFAYRMTNDSYEAEDLVQETFLKAYRYFNNYDLGTNAKAWLFKILKNQYINQYWKKAKQPQQVEYDKVDFQISAGSAGTAAVMRNSLSDAVINALDSLPVDQKTIVILNDIEGFKYDEIATILDLPMGTVKSRLHTARQKLKNKLVGSGYWYENDN